MSTDGLPLPMERTLLFNKQVDQKTIGDITQKILDINADDAYLKKLYKINGLKYKRQPIEIYIDSYGGYVYQILGLVSVMQNSKTPIHKRFAHKHSTPLYHQVSGGTIGTVKEMKESVEQSSKLQDKLEKLTLENTNISKKQLKKVYKRKLDWYLESDEALELGVVDEII